MCGELGRPAPDGWRSIPITSATVFTARPSGAATAAAASVFWKKSCQRPISGPCGAQCASCTGCKKTLEAEILKEALPAPREELVRTISQPPRAWMNFIWWHAP
jgi:hypothetical protein